VASQVRGQSSIAARRLDSESEQRFRTEDGIPPNPGSALVRLPPGRLQHPKMVSDFHIQHRDEVAALKPQPTNLRLNDIPLQIWKPVPAAWQQLLKRLVDNYQLPEHELQLLHNQNFIWAINPNTLAVSRTGKDD